MYFRPILAGWTGISGDLFVVSVKYIYIRKQTNSVHYEKCSPLVVFLPHVKEKVLGTSYQKSMILTIGTIRFTT